MTDPLDIPDANIDAVTPPAGAEMRTTVRRLISLKARVLLDGGSMIDGRTRDLSTGGVGLLMPRPLTPQSKVQVAVQVPKPQTPGEYDVVTGTGKVVFQVLRGDDYQIGIQWLSLDTKTLSLLDAFTEHLAKLRPI